MNFFFLNFGLLTKYVGNILGMKYIRFTLGYYNNIHTYLHIGTPFSRLPLSTHYNLPHT